MKFGKNSDHDLQPELAEVLAFGPYTIDREQRLLTKGDCVIPLAPKLFDLLLVLAESGGRVLEKKILLEKLWPETFVEEGSLSRNISMLRKILGEHPDGQNCISTIPRRGYRFVAHVNAGMLPARLGSADQAVSSAAGQDVTRQVSDDRPAVLPSQPAIIWWERQGSPISFQIRSIAVGRFQNTSGDDSLGHFARILIQALISELSRSRELKVISESVLAEHTENAKSRAEVKGEPQVDFLLTGSVMRIENQLRIIAAIIDPQTHSQLWSQRYDRDRSEILALQEEVACAVAAEIRADLTHQGPIQFRHSPLVKPEAYDCYLRGRFYAHRQNKDDNQTAILALERAVTIDPTFAAAYAELAQAYVWKLFLFAPEEGQWAEKAFIAVEKALSINSNLAVAHLARGRLLWTPANHFPHIAAVREYRRALALDPSLDEARNQLALVYCHIGFLDDALRESQEAALANPNNYLAVYRRAQTLAFQGRYEQALAVLRTIPQHVNPSLIGYQTAWILFNLGNGKETSARLDQLLREYPEDDGALFISMQAVLAASAGKEQRAKSKIKMAVRKGKGFGHFHHSAYHIAIAFALMKEAEQAVRWLDFAATDGFPCVPLFESDANLDNLRQDGRFIKFMVDLKRQWSEYKEML